MTTRDRLHTTHHRVLEMGTDRRGPDLDVPARDVNVVRIRAQRLGPLRWRLVVGPIDTGLDEKAGGHLSGTPVSPSDVSLDAIGAPYSSLPTVEATRWDLANNNLIVDLALVASAGPALHAGLYRLRVTVRRHPRATALEGLLQLPSEYTPAPPRDDLPPVDYLAKDYETIRAFMLERLKLLIPDWQDRDPADIGVMVTEALAYTADRLSYHQDSVAIEAYLATARRRTSVKRHARLLGYTADDGVNSRTWLSFTLHDDKESDAVVHLPSGMDALTGGTPPNEAPIRAVMDDGRVVYRTLEALSAYIAFNALGVYDWGLADFVLPAGATSAVLLVPGGAPDDLFREEIWIGRVLIFQQSDIVVSGRSEPANPALRHAVRVSGVEFHPRLAVPVDNRHAVIVTWREADALPFDFQISKLSAGRIHPDLTFACGNCVLADLGLSIEATLLPDHAGNLPYRPLIDLPDQGATLVHSQRWDAASGQHRSAADAMQVSPDKALPDLKVLSVFAPELAFSPAPDVRPATSWQETWHPRHDLLSSGPGDRHFVVDTGFAGQSTLRFGDGIYGARPPEFHRFRGRLRVARDPTQTVGPDAVDCMAPDTPAWHGDGTPRSREQQVILSLALAAISGVRNPLPAMGGFRAETKETIRAKAPRAADELQSLVTVEDYKSAAEALPDVAQARVEMRWTGSLPVADIRVRRASGRPATPGFCADLAHRLDTLRLAGRDIYVRASGVCPTDIVLEIIPAAGHRPAVVLAAARSAFDPREVSGFFAPAHWPMGKSLFASDVVEHALSVDGVAHASLPCFRRAGVGARAEDGSGGIPTPAAIIPRDYEVISTSIAEPGFDTPLDGSIVIVEGRA